MTRAPACAAIVFDPVHLAPIRLVIISQEMQKTVKDERANFGLERAAIFPGIAAGDCGSDGDVAEEFVPVRTLCG